MQVDRHEANAGGKIVRQPENDLRKARTSYRSHILGRDSECLTFPSTGVTVTAAAEAPETPAGAAEEAVAQTTTATPKPSSSNNVTVEVTTTLRERR